MGLVVHNNSGQSIYQAVAALVAVQGAYRRTAVGGPPDDFHATLGQIPPGRLETSLPFAGYSGLVRFGVDFAFQDAAGRYCLRRADGSLEQTKDDPLDLFNIPRPVPWESG